MMESEVTATMAENHVENPLLSSELSNLDSDVFRFLKSLKIECYFDAFLANGADRLGQLIYVEDSIIDQLCILSNMKLIHAGVFKRAIRECRISSRVSQSENERQIYAIKYDQNNAHISNYQSDNNFNIIDRRRMIVPTNHQNSEALLYSHPYVYQNEKHPPYGRNVFCVEETPRNEAPVNVDSNTHASVKSNETEQILTDGSFIVSIGDRNVRFPPSVHLLTILDRIDNERREIVRKGSQIYGRDDTKRKNNELTPLEVFMNEIAFEICLRDFTYMVSRQRLLGLVREIVKENQIQLSGHHPCTVSVSQNGKSRPRPTPYTPDVDEPQITDYDAILYHKINREWPAGMKKERRKYLGRRSSNFEAIDKALYYAKDHRKRRWVADEAEIAELFKQAHIDNETGCHYSREGTVDRLSQNFYFRNMANVINDLVVQCSQCNSRYRLLPDESPQNLLRFSNENVPKASMVDNSLPEQTNNHKITEYIQNQPPKKSRKSTPHKLIIENGDNSKNTPINNKNIIACDENQCDIHSDMTIPSDVVQIHESLDDIQENVLQT